MDYEQLIVVPGRWKQVFSMGDEEGQGRGHGQVAEAANVLHKVFGWLPRMYVAWVRAWSSNIIAEVNETFLRHFLSDAGVIEESLTIGYTTPEIIEKFLPWFCTICDPTQRMRFTQPSSRTVETYY